MNWIFGGGCLLIGAQFGLAAADPTIPMFLQYGLAAPLLGALWWVYRREANRADRLEQTLFEFIPKLTEVSLALKASTDLMEDIHRERKSR